MPARPRHSRSLISSHISTLESKLSSALRTAICTLTMLGVETSEDQLDYSSLLAGLVDDLSDGELLEELRVGLADCHRTVECLHESRQMDSRTRVAKSVGFLKCFQSKKTEVCVKKNIKQKLLEKLRYAKYRKN